MSDRRARRLSRPHEAQPTLDLEEGNQFPIASEQQLLQSISARAPLPAVLNPICRAFECAIGKVVSLISLPADDGSELATIAMNAADYGLHIFCSREIAAENGERLGFWEVYCVGSRTPSVGEYQMIGRASCLAAVAIQCCQN